MKINHKSSFLTVFLTAACLIFSGTLSGCSSAGETAHQNNTENSTAAMSTTAAVSPPAPAKEKAETKDAAVPETLKLTGEGIQSENQVTELSDPALIMKDTIVSHVETPHLEPDTSYYFDLDSDGTAEKIRYSMTPDYEEENNIQSSLHLFINEEEILTRSSLFEDSGAVYITDADRADSLLEIHCQWTAESDCLALYNFIRYESGTVTNLGDLSGSDVLYGKGTLTRSGRTSFNGDGTFSIEADTPVYAASVGCYYCPLTFALTEGGISEIIQEEYPCRTLLTEKNRPFLFCAAAGFDTYTLAGGEEISCHISPGENVTISKFKFRDDGMFFALVTNAPGQEGWIPVSDEALFEEVPAWG